MNAVWRVRCCGGREGEVEMLLVFVFSLLFLIHKLSILVLFTTLNSYLCISFFPSSHVFCNCLPFFVSHVSHHPLHIPYIIISCSSFPSVLPHRLFFFLSFCSSSFLSVLPPFLLFFLLSVCFTSSLIFPPFLRLFFLSVCSTSSPALLPFLLFFLLSCSFSFLSVFFLSFCFLHHPQSPFPLPYFPLISPFLRRCSINLPSSPHPLTPLRFTSSLIFIPPFPLFLHRPSSVYFLPPLYSLPTLFFSSPLLVFLFPSGSLIFSSISIFSFP